MQKYLFISSIGSSGFIQLDISIIRFSIFKSKASHSQYFNCVLSINCAYVFLESDDCSYFPACQEGNL